MFSRRTAPAHCARGRDSIGRHWRCCPISSSAWAGVSTVRSLLLLVLIGVLALILENLDLLVEAGNDLLFLVDGRVVLLVHDALDLLLLRFLLRFLLLGHFGVLGVRRGPGDR